MTVDSVSSSSGATPSSLTGSATTIAENFDTFLTLLTTQLKNQNPLEPLDTNQFTQQMVQFTSVEQQLKTNEFLEALVLGNQSTEAAVYNAANQAVGLIGKTVVAESTVSSLEDGKASWTYTTSKDAPNTQITIRNASGGVVFQQELALEEGQGTFEWDGKDASGLEYPDGLYSITIDAKDANGDHVSVLSQVRGVVSSVDLTGSEPILSVGGSRITLASVLSVTQPAPEEAA